MDDMDTSPIPVLNWFEKPIKESVYAVFHEEKGTFVQNVLNLRFRTEPRTQLDLRIIRGHHTSLNRQTALRMGTTLDVCRGPW
jgi:hypothetical protein